MRASGRRPSKNQKKGALQRPFFLDRRGNSLLRSRFGEFLSNWLTRRGRIEKRGVIGCS
jgi:hypothetical protein